MTERAESRRTFDLSVITIIDGADPERSDILTAASDRIEVIAITTRREAVGGSARPGGPDVRWIVADTDDHAAVWSLALDAARGTFVVWVDRSVVLHPGALDALADAAITDDRVDVVYCDHEEVEPDGSVVTAFKPNHSPERLRAQDYLSPVTAIRTDLARRLQPIKAEPGVQRYDLALRATERARRVVQVPQVLARTLRRTVPAVGIETSHVRVVADHCVRVGIDAEVAPIGVGSMVRVRRRLAERPLVSVIVPTRGGSGAVFGTSRCFVVESVRSLVEHSTYRELEIVVVHDAETPDSVMNAVRSIAGSMLVAVPFVGEFNFSTKINVGVERANGELLLLLNDDTELIAPESIEVMVGHLQDEGVAMVGAKLLFEDGTLQHGGHVYHGKIHHACFGWPGDSSGPAPLYPLAIERECSGVTAAAALVRRAAFDAVGGFDEAFPLNYNDVDFSLKLRAADLRIIWSPWAVWYHFESRTRRSTLRQDEIELIEQRWGNQLRNDPYYHPALSHDTGDWAEPARTIESPADAPPDPMPDPPPDPLPDPMLRRLRQRAVGALLGPPPPRPRGVNLVGYLDATSGLGERARQLRAVLDAGDIRTSVWNLDLTESTQIGRREERPDDGVVFDTTIAVVTALAFPGVAGVHPLLMHDVDRVIGYWFWELDDIPDSHRPSIGAVDEIWTPTHFVRDAYAAAVDVPVELVPLPIDRPSPSDTDRAGFGFGDREFVFLTSFDHLSSMQRKHPLGVIDAFTRAFPDGGEEVRLVVKSVNGDRRPDGLARLAEAAARDPRIEIRDGYLATSDQAALIAAADSFVSLHRSEGLGLHLAEAMWLGTTVIASRYSGSLDLTLPDRHGDVAELIDVQMVAVSDGGEAYRGGVWAEPDLDQAAAAMRRLVEDGDRCRRLTTLAFDRMVAQADLDPAADRVGAVLARRARPRSRRERVAGLIRRVRPTAR